MLKRWGFFVGLVLGMIMSGTAFLITVERLRGTSLPATTAWVRQAIQTKSQLAVRVDAPKLLLCGGSSVELGLSARQLESRLAMPVVNSGLMVPLGADYLLRCATNVLRPGDVVLLALEFELFDWHSRLWDDPHFVVYLHSEDSAYLAGLPWDQQFLLALKLPDTWILDCLGARLFPKLPPTPSQRSNAWGDRTDNVRRSRAVIPAAVLRPSQVLVKGFSANPKGFAPVRQFCAWAETNAVQVLATFPNLARHSAYTRPVAREVCRQVETFYRDQDVPFIGSFEDVLFPPEDCHDNKYHLFADAVTRRTERLTAQLRPHLVDHRHATAAGQAMR